MTPGYDAPPEGLFRYPTFPIFRFILVCAFLTAVALFLQWKLPWEPFYERWKIREAVMTGDIQAYRTLLKEVKDGGSPLARDLFGDLNLLTLAAANNHFEVAEKLLQERPDLASGSMEEGMWRAIMLGNLPMLKLLASCSHDVASDSSNLGRGLFWRGEKIGWLETRLNSRIPTNEKVIEILKWLLSLHPEPAFAGKLFGQAANGGFFEACDYLLVEVISPASVSLPFPPETIRTVVGGKLVPEKKLDVVRRLLERGLPVEPPAKAASEGATVPTAIAPLAASITSSTPVATATDSSGSPVSATSTVDLSEELCRTGLPEDREIHTRLLDLLKNFGKGKRP